MISAVLILVIASAATGSRPGASSLISAREDTCSDPVVENLHLDPLDTGIIVSWAKLKCQGSNRLIFLDWEMPNGHGDQVSLPSDTEKYYIKGLNPETAVRIVAFVEVTDDGNVHPGDEARASTTTLKKRPTPPRNLRTVDVEHWKAKVVWEPSLEPKFKVDGYAWDVCRVGSCSRGVKADCGLRRNLGNVTSATFSNLSPRTSYNFMLRAYTSNRGGRKLYSGPVSVCVTTPCAPEVKVHGLQINPTEKSLLVSWTKLTDRCPGRKKSTIQLRWKPAGEERKSKSLELSWKSFTITDLKPGTLVEIEVLVTYPGVKGRTILGSPTKTTAWTLNSTPSAPGDFNVTGFNDTTITVEWTAPAVPNGPLDGYVWDLCKVSSCAEVGRHQRGCTIGTPLAPTTTTTYTGLTPDTTYLFFLYAYNLNEKSDKLLSAPAKLCARTARRNR